MKLYYAPGACSLAPHIVAREAGLKLDLDKLDFATRITEGGEVFSDVNPKGYVPALRLDDGSVLTEVATLVQYLADQAPPVGPCPGERDARALSSPGVAHLHLDRDPQGFRPAVEPRPSRRVQGRR